MALSDFHEWAVIRLAVLQQTKQSTGRLLFATVTLLAPGRPIPEKMIGIERLSVGKSGATLIFRRTVLSTDSAITWYRSLSAGEVKAPIPFRHEDIERYDMCTIIVSELVDDPAWPKLGLPVGKDLLDRSSANNHPAPFIGNAPARVHRRIGDDSALKFVLSDEKARGFLTRRLHLDLQHYPEYLGGAALVAPDPIIKQIDNFMVPANAKHGERIIYRFVPRPGQNLQGMLITTFDEHSGLLTDFTTRSIPEDGILEIDKGMCLGRYGYVVSHPEHGPLVHRPPASFIRIMNFSLSAVEKTRRVRVPIGDSPKSRSIEYEGVPETTLASQSVMGGPDPVTANNRIGGASRRREAVQRAQEHGQRWFPNGSREKAMGFVQDQIKQASTRIIIADPYLSGLQLGQFLYGARPSGLTITLMTSAAAFSDTKERNDVPKHKVQSEFLLSLQSLEIDLKANVTAYLLKANILHDRFMVIDDDVWFLGNSLNALGDKASMIVKLPDPQEVIDQLEQMMLSETALDPRSEKIRSGQNNEN
jgi:hypothetical protein